MHNNSEGYPLISVIIPMYNSAKFIPQTLESLLYQTMTDFEVVVIDDCSTDNSVEVVESFSERFGMCVGGGLKLRLIKLPKNTGMPGFPRNIGIQLAHGKYIAFLDSDDLFTKTALEELSTLAEEYQAEIVHMDHFFKLWGGKGKSVDDPAFTDMKELINPANFVKARTPRYTPAKPTLETNDLAERVKKFIAGGYAGEPYTNFYRRDFLITNQIIFLDIRAFEDQIFAFNAMCLAEKLLRVPNVNYILRPRIGSIMRGGGISAVEGEIHKNLHICIGGFNKLKKIMDDIKFFNDNPDYRYTVLDWYTGRKILRMQGIYDRNPHAIIDSIVEKELREFYPDIMPFAAYMFELLNVLQLQNGRLQKRLETEIQKLQAEIAELKNSVVTVE